MTVPELRAVARPGEEGEAIWLLGGLYTYKAVHAETGAYFLCEVQGPKGFAAPLHYHDDEEEGFYVATGKVRVVVGDKTLEAPQGSFVLAPRGEKHAFVLDSADARLVLLLSPGPKHEALFRAIGERATRHEVPTPSGATPDLDKMAETAARHGTHIVGPPPR